ncbi:Protein LIGHT-DEPENDENT SHORT HYPOCOTYLS 6, partial [Cucurbita argyrosperma subsp. sororia]
MSAAVAAAAAAALARRSSSSSSSSTTSNRSSSGSFYSQYYPSPSVSVRQPPLASRYECRKRLDWSKFRQYLRSRCPTLSLSTCTGADIVEFLCYLDEFGDTKVHADTCPNFGHRYPVDPYCDCPTQQPWNSVAGLISRLRVAFEENGGNPVTNPFNAVDVKIYLDDIKDSQNRSRGIDRNNLVFQRSSLRRAPPAPIAGEGLDNCRTRCRRLPDKV